MPEVVITTERSENSGGQYRWDRLLPPGDHNFKIQNVEYGNSKKSGNPMFTMTLISNSGGGVQVTDYLVLDKESLWKFDAMLAAFWPECLKFINEQREKGSKGISFPYDKLVGLIGRVRTKHDTYEGKTKNVIIDYITVGQPQVVTTEVASAAVPAPAPTPEPAAPATAQAPGQVDVMAMSEDEVPW